MARRRVPTVEQIADRQDTDRVERRNGRLYLVDSPEKQAQYVAMVEKMTSIARTRWHIGTVRTYVGMSKEARRFRIETLVARDKVLWAEKYGTELVVMLDKDDMSWSLQQEIETLKASS